MVMRSVGRRKPSARASAAEPETVARPIVSNAACTGACGPYGARSASRWTSAQAAAPAGHDADAHLGQADVRLGVRLDRVAVQQHLAAAAERHARRARRRRETARTRSAAKVSWPARMAASRSSHEAVLASSSTPARLAPTLNCAPSLCSTSARGAIAIVSASRCTMLAVDGVHLRVELEAERRPRRCPTPTPRRCRAPARRSCFRSARRCAPGRRGRTGGRPSMRERARAPARSPPPSPGRRRRDRRTTSSRMRSA